ncbi:NlpC/P60 family protein [Brachybacterium sp. J144]|uniref:C40 family peptidase n=1 Tax=Brachybacterium sp. J144 TaxID=3116487 RepID=UPI002E7884AB|nr:NlpC/P60 family protein [Brachybacterium sp. J144]MEE1652135.1 NlpC/P60 family protein [Brachybacterium sp. J144]
MKKTIATILVVGLVLLAGVVGGTAVMFMHFTGISVQAASSSASTSTCSSGAAPAIAVGDLPVVDGFSSNQVKNAAIIAQAAKDAGLDRRAQLIGIITGMQESDLGDDPSSKLPNVDGDAGVFQQRTYDGWYGSLEMVNDTAYSAKVFFEGVTAQNPGDYGSVGGGSGYGHIPGLKDIKGWEAMAPTIAASEVQRPAERYRGEYAKHTDDANRLLNALSGVDVDLSSTDATGGCADGGAVNGNVETVIETAKGLLSQDLNYGLGSGDQNGPTGGAIDCSAFTSYAWKSGANVDIGRSAQDQWNNLAASRVSVDQIQPGDLIFEAWGRRGPKGDPNAVSHVGMYIGDGQMIESSRSKNGPTISSARLEGAQLVGIARPTAAAAGAGA